LGIDFRIGTVKNGNLLFLENPQSPAVPFELGFIPNAEGKNYLMCEKEQVKITQKIRIYGEN
jgi:N-acetylmuramoyl-L-alanine amidase